MRETWILASAPEARFDDHGLGFAVSVPPHGQWTTCLEVVTARDGSPEPKTQAKYSHGVDAGRPNVGMSLAELAEHLPRLTSNWDTLEATYRRSLIDLAALRFFPKVLQGRSIPAAGLPWFMTIFGRDSLITSLQALPFRPELAETTLCILAARQGTRVDPFGDEEPGKILHEQYRLVHFARKVIGVGSVGTRTWIALFLGRDTGDPLFLQIREAQPSVLEPFLGDREYDNDAQRVVAGQRLMQAASDIFLGWVRVEDLAGRRTDFYVRQLQDWKGSADIERATPRGMIRYGQMCGWTLARAHARCGDRIAIAAYLGSGAAFDEAIAAFAEAYADQNERDHQALANAVKSGRLQATPGV